MGTIDDRAHLQQYNSHNKSPDKGQAEPGVCHVYSAEKDALRALEEFMTSDQI
jgi:hypothetical protein